MKLTKKIDESYRILIPQEIRKILKCNKFDKVELDYEEGTNKITLTFNKNNSEHNLESPSNIGDSTLNNTILEPPTLTITKEQLKEISKKRLYKKDDVISFVSREDLYNLQKCSKCNKQLTLSTITNIKVNNSILCHDCLEILKKELLNK